MRRSLLSPSSHHWSRAVNSWENPSTVNHLLSQIQKLQDKVNSLSEEERIQ